jgi:DNA-directed RNA polymerase specialized sigma24 family protein
MALNPQKVLSSRFVQRLLRRKSAQLAHTAALRHADQEDIQQQLSVELLRRLPRYRRSAAHPKAFIVTVVERQAASLLRHARARKRDCGLVESLSQDVVGEDGAPTTLAATLSPEDGQRRRGNYHAAPLDRHQFATDLAEFVAQLPPEMASLAHQLMKHGPSEVARCQGVPRSTLQDSIDILRKRFREAGLYLTLPARRKLRAGRKKISSAYAKGFAVGNQ